MCVKSGSGVGRWKKEGQNPPLTSRAGLKPLFPTQGKWVREFPVQVGRISLILNWNYLTKINNK